MLRATKAAANKNSSRPKIALGARRGRTHIRYMPMSP
jgi:hypothetical protein